MEILREPVYLDEYMVDATECSNWVFSGVCCLTGGWCCDSHNC